MREYAMNNKRLFELGFFAGNYITHIFTLLFIGLIFIFYTVCAIVMRFLKTPYQTFIYYINAFF